MFFVDKQKMVIEGNALYYLEAGYAWRNKRPDVFFRLAQTEIGSQAIPPLTMSCIN